MKAARCGLIALAIVWCGLWGVLAQQSADPVVANRAQIQSAELVVVGEWTNAAHTELRIEKSLKGPSPGPVVTVIDVPSETPQAGQWIVPLTRAEAGRYAVTHGTLRNAAQGDISWVEASVPAKVYPATDDALSQVNALLPSTDGPTP